ncbi:hypothetical protein ACOME3_007452 [Neoechinorhynchus agilis]
MDDSQIEMPKGDDVFKILVASDNHIGFMDTDPERRDDSLNTFEEILQLARDNEVDFILLGGDLFHENKPSRYSLNRCISLLRHYCCGDNQRIKFDIVSDQSTNFQSSLFPWANFEDPNLRVQIPVFTIHGNHDDPTGAGMLSVLDILSSSGLINYFGKCKNIDHPEILPILMQKGCSKLALYGLGSTRDERIHHLFSRNHVDVLRPKQDQENWFSIFVIHQNNATGAMVSMIGVFSPYLIWHWQQSQIPCFYPSLQSPLWVFSLTIGCEYAKRPVRYTVKVPTTLRKSNLLRESCTGCDRIVRGSSTNFIPEHFLNAFLDLIIWGHEHDCHTNLSWNPIQQFYVNQPGSSVATSLNEGEDLPKHVFLLKVYQKNFVMEPLALKTVRQFFMETIHEPTLPKYDDGRIDSVKLEKVLTKKVDGLIEDAQLTRSGHCKQPLKPLVRIRLECDYDDAEIHSSRFGQRYVDKVANPKTMISFKRKLHRAQLKVGSSFTNIDLTNKDDVLGHDREVAASERVEFIMNQYFKSAETSHKLELFTEKDSIEAIIKFVDKDERVSIHDFVESSIDQIKGSLKATMNEMRSGAQMDAYFSSISIDDVSLKRIAEMDNLELDEAASNKPNENIVDKKRSYVDNEDGESFVKVDATLRTQRGNAGTTRRRATRRVGRTRGRTSIRDTKKKLVDDFDAPW